MTRYRLLKEIDSGEIAEWMAYERISGPMGVDRADWHAAQVTQGLIAQNLKKGCDLPDLDKLLLPFGEEAEPELTEEECEERGEELYDKLKTAFKGKGKWQSSQT